ncbi:hypothetical protein [Streptomyces sp. CBMA123]|uniref:hypothetical protein n=1 Tax=Streptomyces sp. CBMA123 TaxID=1896313 RepID=UPI001661E231|nr:hypothetical protein [Streptomyces sp. CBMA123]
MRDVAGGVRDLLRDTGAYADNKWRRGLRQGRQNNVLFGVALRAAERRGLGYGLTELEESVLDILGAVLTDQEIAAAGSEYRATVRDLGEVPLLPPVVTAKPVAEGFGLADLIAHLPAMRQENAGRANCAQVDLAAVAAGQPVDSTAFTAALGDVGFGVTALTGPPPADPDRLNPTYKATFQFESFTCRRAVGDQGGGRDEIYFTAAARSDKTTGGTYQSLEFGAVVEGDTRTFRADRKLVFEGPAGEFVVMLVQVWEADQSPSEWYDKLFTVLEAWLNRPIWVELTLTILKGITGVGGEIIDAVETVLQIFVSLKEVLRDLFQNGDDLSCERMFVFDRHALVTLYNRKDAVWEFNGDGHHSLQVKYTGDRPVFPFGALEYVTWDPVRSTWSAPVTLGWESSSPAELCSFQGKLHCMYIRPGDRAVMWSVLEDGVWRVPVQVSNNWRSDYRPALAEHNGKLHAVVVALEGYLVTSHLNGNSWPAVDVKAESEDAPCLVRVDTKLRCLYRQPPGSLWEVLYLNFDDSNGTWLHTGQGTGIKTHDQMGATDRLGHMVVAFRDSQQSGKLRLLYKDLAGGESTPQPIPSGWSTPDGPAIATNANNTLWLAVRGGDGRIVAAQTNGDGGYWYNRHDVTHEPVMAGQPTLAPHNGVMHLMYRR